MPWTTRLSPEATKQLEELPPDRLELIGKVIERMKHDPFRGNVKALQGKQWKGRFRTAVGRYRLIFIPYHREQSVEISQILLRTEKTYH